MEKESHTEQELRALKETLTLDEVKVLKELADNLMAMGRVKRVATTTVLWFAGVIVAGFVIWDKFLVNIHWGK